jgi:Predicted ABC-type transport system involved in lysophospholipase L1 biosynthesis, permease component
MAPSFILKMAWRDSRTSRMRLLLFSLSITVGVAALVAIGSFRQSLSQSIDDQARTLVGADLIIESTRPFTTTEEGFLGSIGGAQAREVRLSTMAVFPAAVRAWCIFAPSAATSHSTERWKLNQQRQCKI